MNIYSEKFPFELQLCLNKIVISVFILTAKKSLDNDVNTGVYSKCFSECLCRMRDLI